jgi:hypothetical protein
MTSNTHLETIPDPQTNVTRARAWARDLALIGAVSAGALPLLLGASATFAIVASIASALIGAAIGSAAPYLLNRHVRRVPVLLLLGAGAGLGANWGAVSATVAALATGEAGWRYAAQLGATAGLALLGAFWMPAVLLRARGRSTVPAILAALSLCPAIAVYLALAY